MLTGIFSALGASFFWTYACFLWRRQTKQLPPLTINLAKNVIAFIIFFPVLFTFDYKSNAINILLLILSGSLGISIGDSLYITALKKIGTRKTLAVEAFSPLLATALGSILLKEILPIRVCFGILIVTISLLGIAFEKNSSNIEEHNTKNQNKGLIFAFLSVFFAVMAAIISRKVLLNSSLSPVQTSEIRLFGSIFC